MAGENLNQNQQQLPAGQAPASQPATGANQPQMDIKPFEELAKKKGFKDVGSFAKMYEDMETAHNRSVQQKQTLKQQVEQSSQGSMTIDETGNLAQNPNFQSQPQGQSQGQPEPVYDSMTGKPIVDPTLLQAAMLPFGQRELFFANVALEVRDKQQQASYQAEQDVLNTPEAKGFENDLRNIMYSLPLQRRANKEEWKDALLRVKGMKFDQMKQTAQQEGVDNLLSKFNIQPLPESGGNTGGVKLTTEQEQSFQWYQVNQPGMFKDRAHFLSRYSPKR